MPTYSHFTQTSEFDHHREFNALFFQHLEIQQLLKKYNRLIIIRDKYAQIDLNEPNLEIERKQKERVNALAELNNFSTATIDFLSDCQKTEAVLREVDDQIHQATLKLNKVTEVKNSSFNFETVFSVWPALLLPITLVIAGIMALAASPMIPLIISSVLAVFSLPAFISLAVQYYNYRQAVKNATQEEPAVKEELNSLEETYENLQKEMLSSLEEKYKNLQIDASNMSQQNASSSNSLTFFPASSGFEVSTVVNPKQELSDAYSQTEETIRPVF